MNASQPKARRADGMRRGQTPSFLEYNETYWERIGAGTRWGRYLSFLEETAIRRAMQALAPGRAFEFGCDGGRWCAMLASNDWDVVGVDVDATGPDIASRRVPDGRFSRSVEGELPVDDASVRLALAIEVPAAHHDWVLDELARILEPDGLLVYSTTNKRSWRGARRHRSGDFPESHASYRRRLAERGILVEHAVGACWFPFHRSSDSRLIPPAVWVERHAGLTALPDVSPAVIGIARKGRARSRTTVPASPGSIGELPTVARAR